MQIKGLVVCDLPYIPYRKTEGAKGGARSLNRRQKRPLKVSILRQKIEESVRLPFPG